MKSNRIARFAVRVGLDHSSGVVGGSRLGGRRQRVRGVNLGAQNGHQAPLGRG